MESLAVFATTLILTLGAIAGLRRFVIAVVRSELARIDAERAEKQRVAIESDISGVSRDGWGSTSKEPS